jgi:hypothetical protein
MTLLKKNRDDDKITAYTICVDFLARLFPAGLRYNINYNDKNETPGHIYKYCGPLIDTIGIYQTMDLQHGTYPPCASCAESILLVLAGKHSE